ncbi:MAG: protein kinase [Planctomycetes bacterium]|nr:protein kinase [Planctomycetota bacterium]
MTDQTPKKKHPSQVNADQPTVISSVKQEGADLLTRVADLSGQPPQSNRVTNESLVTKVMTDKPSSPMDQTRATDLHVAGSSQTKGKEASGTHNHQVWGDFELGDLLGRGGMGSVYRGRQISLDRPVAIKVLPLHLSENENFRQRFQLEAKAVAQISSPHVVGVYYAGVHEGHHYFAMEYVEGKDLSVRLRDGFKPTHREVLDLVTQATRGLAAAGDLGIVHRDIKPGNMMVTTKGLLKLMDFGLVRVASTQDTGLTMAGTIMGTVSYFSPEQGRGDRCDCRTDIYAIGVVFYELLTRRLPFTGGDATSVIYQHIHQDPKLPKEIDPSIPEAYQAVVLKCLQKDQADRYQTATELLSDLEALAKGLEPVTAFTNLKNLRAGGTLVKNQAFEAETRSRGLLWAALVVILAGGGIGGYVFMQNQKPVEPPVIAPVTLPVADPRVPEKASDPAEARALIAAGDLAAARAQVAFGLKSAPQDATWIALGKEIDAAQGANEVKRAQTALAANDLDGATSALASAARLLGDSDERVKSLKATLDGRSDGRRMVARLLAEAETHLTEGNPARAEEVLTPIVAADPANEAAAMLLRRAKKENQGLTARSKAVQERLAQGEEALARKDLDAALLHFTAAQQLEPNNPRATAGLDQVTKTKGALSTLREQFEKALKERNLPAAEGSLKAMRQLAPGSPTLVLAENEFTNSKLVEETQNKAAGEKEAAIVAQAAALAKLMEDPAQGIPQLEQSLASFLERNGANRAEKTMLETKLEDRRSQAAVGSRIGELDAALAKGDTKLIATLVRDTEFAKALAELAQEPGLVFASTMNGFTRTGDSATATVGVRHALSTFPERILKLTYQLTRSDGKWVISGATLNP